MIAAERVYLALGREPVRATAIAAALGYSPAWVREILRGLVAEGAVLALSAGYARRPLPAPRIADLTRADHAETIGDFSFASY